MLRIHVIAELICLTLAPATHTKKIKSFDSKRGGFEPNRRHCVVSLGKNINPSLVLVQPRKTRPFITERLLMGRKESNQTNKRRITRNVYK